MLKVEVMLILTYKFDILDSEWSDGMYLFYYNLCLFFCVCHHLTTYESLKWFDFQL